MILEQKMRYKVFVYLTVLEQNLRCKILLHLTKLEEDLTFIATNFRMIPGRAV
jgi:hypothetical protein